MILFLVLLPFLYMLNFYFTSVGNVFTHEKSEDPKIILKELHVPNNISWSKLMGLLRFCCVF